jgi:ribosomal protein S1
MVEIGSMIEATVTRLEPYGIWFKYQDQDGLILIPEVAWQPVQDLQTVARVGDRLKVYVLRYNYRDRAIVGSLRRLRPEENPYRQLARLEAGSLLPGKVMFSAGDHVTIELANGAWGHIPQGRFQRPPSKGEGVDVVISDMEVDEGRLVLDLARSSDQLDPGPTVR